MGGPNGLAWRGGSSAAQSGLAAATEALTGPVAGGRLMNDSVPHQALEGAVRGEMARAASLGAAAMRVTPQSADLTQPWHFFRFGLRTTALSGATSLLAGGKASIYLCAGASYTVDLPPVADMKHAVLIFKKTAPGGSITIDADDSETIDGALTKILSNQNDSIIIVCDGSGWHILAGWP